MYKPKTDEELRTLAKDLADGKVFTDRHIPENDPNLLTAVFMILIFLDDKQREEMENDNITLIYEYLDKAGSRSINGCPSFMSLQMLNKDDMVKMHGYYNKYKELMAQYQQVTPA